MKHLQTIKFLVLTFIILTSATSCSKDDMGNKNSQLAAVSVSLKSTTQDLNKVYLDIEDVQIRVKEEKTATNAWVSLNAINTGTHNVSALNDDAQLQLVDFAEIESAYVYEIRIVLSDNNFIDINQTLFSLDVLDKGNATPSNLVNTEFQSNHIYDIVIDLNLDESISFNATDNMMVLNPKLYTQIRDIQY
ncbi:DUF4382 domain-containing protein [Winogradskyella thalassocola]|uniref:DUF4382 domain-containing protein n=1 Tax=Winogradskyella thalassocola TaxID=262004 RepID=A0A1G7XIY1_9FLAO|nr:DUF4382 domain-containing protein [Winogradskyella thalassocola]SDG84158.1 protein of unknown function [Winogradskyella thalassocola]